VIVEIVFQFVPDSQGVFVNIVNLFNFTLVDPTKIQ
jgi:hypothetical protein